MIAWLLACTPQVEGWSVEPANWSREPGPAPVFTWLDSDGDGDRELFLSGGEGQRDAVLDLVDGRLVDLDPQLELGALVPAEAAAAADLDGDGDEDLLVLREDGLHSHLATPEGYTHLHRWLPPAQGARFLDLEVGDLDRDGDPDLVIALDRAPGVLVYRNDGLQGLREIGGAAGLPRDEAVRQALLVDLDEDGRLDLVLRGERTRAFRNTGLGPFHELALELPTKAVGTVSLGGQRSRELLLTPQPAAVLDLDHDHLEDLAMVVGGEPLLLVQREGAWARAEGLELPVPVESVAAAELDERSPAELIWIPNAGPPLLSRCNP